MSALAVKPEYGPTLARLLAPRWRAASRRMRVLLCAACASIVALVLTLTLTLVNSRYAHGGRVPFNFAYRGLYRVAPEAGGYVRVERRTAAGALEDSFGVNPFKLPAYSGAVTGEMPLFATGYIRRLAARRPGFVLRGEGKARLTTALGTLTGYQVAYTARVEGREMYGRDLLVVPDRNRVREGVAIAMLTTPGESSQVRSPVEVGTAGILLGPLKTFALG